MCFTSKKLYFTWGGVCLKLIHMTCVYVEVGVEGCSMVRVVMTWSSPRSPKEPLTLYIPVVPSTMCSVVNILFWQQLM